jgi:hypothetical protein
MRLAPSRVRTVLLLGLLVSWSGALSAQSSQLLLTVLDGATSEPIRNAMVEVGGLDRRAQTNAEGVVRIGRVPAGSRIVTVTRLGYEAERIPVEFAAAGVIEQTVRLTPEPVAVGGVTATGEARDPGLEMRGFYDRQARGLGAFMTTERIEELNQSRTVDLFRYMRGFKLNYDRRRGEYYVVANRGGGLGGDCSGPMVYLDGTLVADRANYFQFVNPENIAAIEAFAGPSQVPVEYRSNAACGVILIWSRTGPRGRR